MIVYGKNVAKEIINNKIKINKVFLLKSFNDRGIIEYLDNNNIRRIIIDKKQMEDKCGKNHQGIMLDIEDYKYSKIETSYNDDFVVILDHLEDPHNFGAIIRTCEAAGIKSIIIPKDRSVDVNSTVMKVSAGALNNVNIIEVNNIVSAINKLKKNGFWIYAADMDGSSSYTELEYSSKTALIVGAEGNGVGRLVKDNCDFIINIPMYGKINSLNASVAAGIVIYEVVKQKGRR